MIKEKKLFNVVDGTWPLPMAVERIKKNTRVYAKKQMTWFQRDPDIKWIDIDSLTIDQQIAKVVDIIQNKIDTMS